MATDSGCPPPPARVGGMNTFIDLFFAILAATSAVSVVLLLLEVRETLLGRRCDGTHTEIQRA